LNTSRAGSLETAREIAPVYIRRLKKEEEKRERERKSRVSHVPVSAVIKSRASRTAGTLPQIEQQNATRTPRRILRKRFSMQK